MKKKTIRIVAWQLHGKKFPSTLKCKIDDEFTTEINEVIETTTGDKDDNTQSSIPVTVKKST